jgi:hypothetical protein
MWMSARGNMLNGLFGKEVGESLEGATPSTNLSQYVVKDGDTYETIAQLLYGDESFADQLRTYNARTSDFDTLASNQTLRLPQLLPIHNIDRMNNAYARFMSTL